jgi:hypothetical protein
MGHSIGSMLLRLEGEANEVVGEKERGQCFFSQDLLPSSSNPLYALGVQRVVATSYIHILCTSGKRPRKLSE